MQALTREERYEQTLRGIALASDERLGVRRPIPSKGTGRVQPLLRVPTVTEQVVYKKGDLMLDAKEIRIMGMNQPNLMRDDYTGKIVQPSTVPVTHDPKMIYSAGSEMWGQLNCVRGNAYCTDMQTVMRKYMRNPKKVIPSQVMLRQQQRQRECDTSVKVQSTLKMAIM